ncbi:hypothetical protein [Cupriavidus campinensis]|uniref:hypothetical protein n=1 Tax=Cupriavidus campinensis TaxID=151783 RepID=UPI0024E20DD3|nr:hypothetical protein [Cupriavidus campinensis]
MEMEHIRNGLAALLEEWPEEATPRKTYSLGKTIDQMTELELMYQLCITDGLEIIGDPTKAFAAYDAGRGSLRVYSMNNAHVQMTPCDSTSRLAVLEYAQTHGASFSVTRDEVTCTIDDVSATGKTYFVAALRTMAKYHATHRPE